MIVVGLIHEGDRAASPGSRRARGTFRGVGLGWVAAFGGLMAGVPVAEHQAGGVAGYGVLLAAVTLGAWRLDRWAGRQYWRGLGERRE